MVIRGFEYSEELLIELGRFVVLWNKFENEFFNCDCKRKKIINIDSEIIIKSKEINEFRQVLLKRLSGYRKDILGIIQYDIYRYKTEEEIGFFKNINDSFVKESFWEDVQIEKNTKSITEDVSYIYNFLSNNGDEVVGCVMTMYRIRNNLMHGVKESYNLENQIDIFKTMNNVLDSLKKAKR